MLPADLVLVGGGVMTVDAAGSTASAVAVRDGRIVEVGDDRTVLEHEGPRTRRLALGGRTVLPGFTDAHVHPVMAGIELRQCSLHELPESRDAYLEAIRAYAAAHPELEWIVGSGWGMAAFPGGTPTREDLDAAVPGRPAIFDNRDGHGSWVNALALERAGITRETADPPDGRTERTSTGGARAPSTRAQRSSFAGCSRRPPATISPRAWWSRRHTSMDSGSRPGRTRSWTRGTSPRTGSSPSPGA